MAEAELSGGAPVISAPARKDVEAASAEFRATREELERYNCWWRSAYMPIGKRRSTATCQPQPPEIAIGALAPILSARPICMSKAKDRRGPDEEGPHNPGRSCPSCGEGDLT